MCRFPVGCIPEKTRVFMVEGNGRILIVSNFELTVEKLVYGGDGLAKISKLLVDGHIRRLFAMRFVPY